ncbi:MAG: pantetheine-phosphate adenylyltransferase [Rhodospirillales bacterium CG15_BIG_FIL_POST_REV_8_21_14_020_66_15]|nr:MAG: pantetheine-phosphate adenylyltransferase [Rhodospirillales bacterium CG15_BIG_FIL_POST_REV_8_21_14_020_66_15]
MPVHRGVYPGTFDPVTRGHMDIITRGARVVDNLIVAVAVNAGKGPLFSLEERVDMLKSEIAALGNGLPERIEVRPFDNLLIEFVGQMDASLIIRGLRAVSDFEYEFQMAGMNARLNPRVETVFLMASERHQFISSRFVKEIGELGGDIGQFVSDAVKARLHERFAERRNAAD